MTRSISTAGQAPSVRAPASAGWVLFALAIGAFAIGTTEFATMSLLPWLADRALMPTAAGLLLWSAATTAIFPFVAGHLWALSVDGFCIAFAGALGTILQTRLMDVAQHAQGLAAALNHSAFNFANALGPLLGGIAIAGGYGWTSPGWVGTALALSGFAILMISLAVDRSRRAQAAA